MASVMQRKLHEEACRRVASHLLALLCPRDAAKRPEELNNFCVDHVVVSEGQVQHRIQLYADQIRPHALREKGADVNDE